MVPTRGIFSVMLRLASGNVIERESDGPRVSDTSLSCLLVLYLSSLPGKRRPHVVPVEGEPRSHGTYLKSVLRVFSRLKKINTGS